MWNRKQEDTDFRKQCVANLKSRFDYTSSRLENIKNSQITYINDMLQRYDKVTLDFWKMLGDELKEVSCSTQIVVGYRDSILRIYKDQNFEVVKGKGTWDDDEIWEIKV